MITDNFQSKIIKKEVFLFFGLYLSLLIGFYFGENSTGGAYGDYQAQKNIVKAFKDNFLLSLFNYDDFTSRHSPVLIISLSVLENFIPSDFILRLIHLHLCLLLPLFFYKCLEVKYKSVDKRVFLLLTSLILLSPSFRSLSIWPDSRILGLTFFTLSIFYYLKFLVNKKFLFVSLNIITCGMSAYISPNFCVFSLFFFTKYLIEYKLISYKLFFVIILNFLIALPAFYYVIYLDINFFSKSAAILRETSDIVFVNIFNDILITFSLMFFYLFPFIVFKIIKVENLLNFKNIIFSILVFVISVYNFDYNYLNSGGGIFLQGSQIFLANNYLFFFVSFFSVITVLPILITNSYNLLLFILILMNNPQYTMYHKYFDPFLLISFFTIFILKINSKLFLKIKPFLFVYFYFISFLIISNIKFLWKI